MRTDLSNRSPRLVLVTVALFAVTSLMTSASDDIQWKQIGPGGGGNMFSVGVSPADPNIALMGGDVGGIFRTGDGGQTWTVANQAMIDPTRFGSYGSYGHFQFDPAAPSIVYKGGMKSTDAGVSWKINVDESQLDANSSLVDSSSHLVVYAFGYANVYRSSDGWESTSCVTASGASCSPKAPLTSCDPKTHCYQNSCLPLAGSGQTSTPGCVSYLDAINDVVQDPTAPSHLLACADSGLYQSLDSATTWTQITPASLPYQNCQALVLNYKVSGHVRTLYMLQTTHPIIGANPAGTWTDIDTWRGGVYQSTNWGSTWTAVNGTDEGNILPDPGFETAGDSQHPAANWKWGDAVSPTLDCGVRHSGTCSLRFDYTTSAGTGVETDPMLSIQGGELFKVSAWVKSSSSTGGMLDDTIYFFDAQQQPLTFPGVYWNSVEPIYYSSDTPISFDWRRMESLFRAPDAARYMNVTFGAHYGNGTTWLDDVSVVKTHTIAKTTGPGGQPWFVNYYDLAVDPTDANTVYVGSQGGTWADWAYADGGGIWKTTDGGTTWTLTTRHQWHDSVLDSTVPECGDDVCGGKWENCNSCAVDCTGWAKPVQGCCGDGVCNLDETYDNCLADCPFDPDPNHGPGYEVESFTYVNLPTLETYYAARGNGNGGVGVWSIGIGSGTAGHQTLYAGGEHLKTINGGTTWTEMSTVLYTGSDSQAGTAQARGATNDVFTYRVVTDTRPDEVTGQPHNWVLYGDTDNLLQVSYNGGKSFAEEGWQWSPDNHSPNVPSVGVVGDAATSIVLDPNHANRVYVGMNVQAADNQGVYDPSNYCCGGALQGDFTPATPPVIGRWDWTPLGDQMTFPKGVGGVELIQTASGDFYAAVYSRGVYKLIGSSWINTDTGSNWNPVPAGWKTYRLIEEPASGRLYVSAGTTINTPPQSSDETGVWESTDNGGSWNRITDPNSNTGTGMDREPVQDIAFDGPNTLFVATWYGYQMGCSLNPCYDSNGRSLWNGDGGLYKGTRDVNGNWTWAKVIAQPRVTGVTVSPSSGSVLYSFVGQDCCSGSKPGQYAGIYKSVDGGDHWLPLTNNGLMRIDAGKLYFSSNDPHKLYASTIGDGVFEGTMTCGTPSEGFADSDGDGVPDCAFKDVTQQVTMTTGSIVSGTYTALSCTSAPNTNEVLSEQTSGTKRKMVKVWKFDNVPTGKAYELWVEGYRNVSANDNFDFGLITKPAGSSCSVTDTYGPTPLLTVTKTSDDNQAQKANAGAITNPVVCVRVQDSNQNADSQTDTLTLDRVCLRGL